MTAIKLRPYQEKSVEDIRKSYLSNRRAPLLVAPTGSGKTVVFSFIAGSSSKRNKRVLILVNRIELIRQTSQKLIEFNVPHGIINPKYSPDYSKSVQLASVMTLNNRLSKIYHPDVIIIDECHGSPAASYKKVLEYFPAALKLGVTATPIRLDGKGLGVEAGGIFDDLIPGPTIKELTKLGYLVPCQVYTAKKAIDLINIKIKQGDYDRSALSDLLNKRHITGQAIAHYKQLCDGKPAVVFCSDIKHAESVAEDFANAGYRAFSVDGTMDDATRKNILDGLTTGAVQVVTSVDLISQGTDIPAIECAILLRPTKSTGLYIQQVGRSLRLSPGKTKAIILDHVGNVLRHGMPDEDREWSLEGAERKRGGNGEASISVSICKSCYAAYPPQIGCPYCGHVEPVKERKQEVVEGELVMVSEEHAAFLKEQKKVMIGSAKTLAELQDVGKQLGYDGRWAYMIWKSRQVKKGQPAN